MLFWRKQNLALVQMQQLRMEHTDVYMNMISVEYYHLELESHFSVIANGVLSESYLHFDGHCVFNDSIIINENKNVLIKA